MKNGLPKAEQLRAFVPARDFEMSKRFYLDLGFSILQDTQQLAELSYAGQSFLLQNYFEPAFTGSLMMHLVVPDVSAWWQHVSTRGLEKRYDVRPPEPPREQLLGRRRQRVMFFHDPSGILWHVAEFPGDFPSNARVD